MTKMNMIIIGRFLVAALLLVCIVQPVLAQDSIGPLLENDLLLNEMEGVTGRVRVDFDGARYLAVWSQIGDPEDDLNNSPGIWGQFLTTDGVKEGPILKIWAENNIPASNPDIAWNGSCYVVVWRDLTEINGIRVADDGTPGNPFNISFSSPGLVVEHPAIASNGDDFFVVWMEYESVKGCQITVTDQDTMEYKSYMTLSTDGYSNVRPAVCYGNTEDKFFVTWSHQESDGDDYDLYGALITPTTATSTEPDSVFAVADGNGDQGGAIPAGNVFDGTNFIVAYAYDNWVKAVTVSPDAVVGTPLEVANAPSLDGTDVTVDNLGWFVVWGTDGLVKGARVQDGFVVDSEGVNLSSVEASAAQPSVLLADGNYLVLFEGLSSFDKYAQVIGLTNQTPEEMLNDLIDEVLAIMGEYNIPNGSINLLETSSSTLNDANTNNDVSAIGKLNAFINQVEAHQNNGDIPPEEANILISAAQAIIDELENL
jgi:hypothetical protein